MFTHQESSNIQALQSHPYRNGIFSPARKRQVRPHSGGGLHRDSRPSPAKRIRVTERSYPEQLFDRYAG
eukprot:g74219.t1